eukprot:5758974-Amphidinium_carterae.1
MEIPSKVKKQPKQKSIRQRKMRAAPATPLAIQSSCPNCSKALLAKEVNNLQELWPGTPFPKFLIGATEMDSRVCAKVKIKIHEDVKVEEQERFFVDLHEPVKCLDPGEDTRVGMLVADSGS